MNFESLNEQCLISVHLGNATIEQFQIPLLFSQHKFIEIVKAISKENRPMQVKCLRQDFSESGRCLDNCLIFQNLSWVKEFNEEDKKEDKKEENN